MTRTPELTTSPARPGFLGSQEPSDGQIPQGDFGGADGGCPAPVIASPDGTLEGAKRLFVLAVLARHRGDKKAAAAQLGVSLKSLYNWLHEWGLMAGGAR